MRQLTACLLVLSAIAPLAFSQKASNCTVWQLASQYDKVGNSYVFRMENGKVAVMDGGGKEEAMYLRGFLAALGNEVEAWFISHPHSDHVGALNEIIQNPEDIRIKTIYHSEYLKECYEPIDAVTSYQPLTKDFYATLNKSGIDVVNITDPGGVIQIDETKFKILTVTNKDITDNFYNNNSMVIKVWDQKKSFIFLGDLAEEAGDLLLKGPYRDDLTCDYLQMSHHGNRGVRLDFYRSIKFSACLWPTPLWLWNNDRGKGFNTHHYTTVETRNLMDELGIKEHYVSWQGLCKIE